MPLRLRDVVALPDLGLALRGDPPPGALDRPVRWVAVSELDDPGPYLEGGELVLTTGLRYVDDPDAATAYIGHLVQADVTALGFGVGVSHDEVPPHLVASAARAGLPLVVVPAPTPFIAVTKAVTRQLAAEEYDEAARGFTAQRDLIRAVLAPDGSGAASVVTRLARHLGGFALLLDPAASVVHAAPPEAARRSADLVEEVARLRPRGLLASSVVATADEYLVLQPLGVDGRARGFLAVGAGGPLGPHDQAVVNLAVSLLSLELGRADGRSAADRGLRSVAVGLLLDGRAAELPMDALGWGALRRGRVRVALVQPGADGAAAAEDRVREAAPGAAVAVRAAGAEPRVVALLPEDCTLEGVDLGAGVAVGLSEPAPALTGAPGETASALARAAGQAAQALAASVASGSGWTPYAALRSRGLEALLEPEATDAWARALLEPLDAPDERSDLRTTLRVWLEQHGQVDAAAGRLGVHRHTVRHRLRRAEALLGRSLDDPAVRAELWVALGRTTGPDPS
ncbi:MAG: PucR family transcriptional regulator [Candidatus Nanopelagicales bacterium]